MKEKAIGRTRPYIIWNGMIQRCNGKCNTKNYKDKGIRVCEKWLTFLGFWDDMKNTYKDNLTIDRIDNTKGYFKENCRWTSMVEQQNNRCNNHYLDFNGIKMTIANWGRKLNINPNRIHLRIYRGWSVEKTLSTPFILIPQRRKH